MLTFSISMGPDCQSHVPVTNRYYSLLIFRRGLFGLYRYLPGYHSSNCVLQAATEDEGESGGVIAYGFHGAVSEHP